MSTQRATGLAKAKQNLKWQRDPEGMRLRILEAAKQEFAAHGLAGARVDRIAVKAGANKRMLYYHVGKKDELYLAVLEGAYEKIRSAATPPAERDEMMSLQRKVTARIPVPLGATDIPNYP